MNVSPHTLMFSVLFLFFVCCFFFVAQTNVMTLTVYYENELKQTDSLVVNAESGNKKEGCREEAPLPIREDERKMKIAFVSILLTNET